MNSNDPPGDEFPTRTRRAKSHRLSVLPVIDLKGGLAVHGRAGERHRYLPVQSVLAAGADPLELARGVRCRLQLSSIYLADLDAIGGAEPQWPLYQAIVDLGFRIWLDAGVSIAAQAEEIVQRLGHGVELIVGLESLASVNELLAMAEYRQLEEIVVSFDLKHGKVQSPRDEWRRATPRAVAEQLIELGVRRLILLDVSRVGMAQGTGTRDLARELRTIHAKGCRADEPLELWCGGGINSLADLHAVAQDGCDGVLIATALHSGHITVDHLRQVGALG